MKLSSLLQLPELRISKAEMRSIVKVLSMFALLSGLDEIAPPGVVQPQCSAKGVSPIGAQPNLTLLLCSAWRNADF